MGSHKIYIFQIDIAYRDNYKCWVGTITDQSSLDYR